MQYWWLADRLFFQAMEAVYDLAILNKDWTAEAYYNLLKEDFSSVFNFLNFPYSQGQSHALWCCYQMVEMGANIICIGPEGTLFTQQCAKLVTALTFRVPAGNLTFKNWDKALPLPIMIICFFQPEFADLLAVSPKKPESM